MSNQETKTISSQISQRSYTYCTQDKLGSGSFAEVFKGKIDQTNEEIAIKVISKVGIAKYGPDIRNAIGSEVNILQKISLSLTTPYIVRIYECFETQNNIYIILEYCNQGTLADVLKTSKTLPEKESLIIIYQIVLALNVMATKEMAHRDIKPENIFIHEGIYKIGDFGFASQKKLFQTTLGTYPYMAPEIFQNKEYSNKVDIWAVAVVLHEMLFGELYFIGNSHMEVANNVQKKKYELKQPCHLSPETQNLLIKCLEKNPDLRMTAQEMKNHKAFDAIRGLPCFSNPSENKSVVSSSSHEAFEAKVLIDNYVKAVSFLENLGNKIFEHSKNGRFARFYLINEGLKQLMSLSDYLNNHNDLLMNLINENKRKAFFKSKFYDESKSMINDYFKNLSQEYNELMNELSNQISSDWPKEKNLILILINNALDFDIENLYKEELISTKMSVIKCGDQYLKNNAKEKGKEKFLLAYEINLAMDMRRLLNDQFDFSKYEINKKNLDFEDILKHL